MRILDLRSRNSGNFRPKSQQERPIESLFTEASRRRGLFPCFSSPRQSSILKMHDRIHELSNLGVSGLTISANLSRAGDRRIPETINILLIVSKGRGLLKVIKFLRARGHVI